jgi:predicted ATPase
VTSRLIGRQAERARLVELAAPGATVTVTGPGGIGKSRLVADVVGGVAGPVTTGRLAALPARAGPAAVADALGFESVDAAAVGLAEQGGVVVLDCCEHVLDAVRTVIGTVRQAAPDVTVISSSRAPIGVPGEHVHVLGPLPAGPAVELFVERAAAAGAEPPDDLGDVAELCARLDGLPLAIELAAARARSIAPGELLRAVDQRLDLLRRSDGRGDRHDSMRAAIEVSTGLLDEQERRVFDLLGVFSGPFDLALAAAVVGADRATVLDVIGTLVERSLVVAEPTVSGTTYRLLELLREHAAGSLAAAGATADVEERFVDAMVGVADGIVAAAFERWDPALLGAASRQFANLVRATELCLAHDAGPERAYRLLLPMFAAVHEGRALDVWTLGERVRARWPGDDAPWRAEVGAVLATAAAIGGRSDDVGPLAAEVVDDPTSSAVALALADRAWGLATRAADPIAAAEHFALARAAAQRAGFGSMAREVGVFEAGELDLAGEPERARSLLAEVQRGAEHHDDVFVVVLAHLVRCSLAMREGAADEARREIATAEAISAAIGHPWWRAALLRTAAAVEAVCGDGWDASRWRWRVAVDSAAGGGHLGEVAITLRTAAAVAHHLGFTADAEVLHAAAPRTTAITVLPALWPESAAALAAVAVHPRPLVDSLAAARGVLEGSPPPVAAPVPTAGTGELAVDGDGWRVTFDGRTVRVRDMKGIGDLAVLVTRPGVEIHALELMGGGVVEGGAGPALDDRARREYQARIIELQREIDEAHDHHDNGRAERAEVELDALVAQLSEAFGLGGRARPTGSSAERARSAVTYRVRAAIKKVGELHPELGRHLTNAVRTGTWCAYRPERDITWTVDLTV